MIRLNRMTVSHFLIILSSLSFFYFRWLVWTSDPSISVDGVYFAVLLFVAVAFSLAIAARGKDKLDSMLKAHLALLALCLVTVAWTPRFSSGMREAAPLFYGWLIHFLSRQLDSSEVPNVYKSLMRVLTVLLFVSVGFITVGVLRGDLGFSLEDQIEITDKAGYYIIPIDLVSGLTFLVLGFLASGGKKRLWLAPLCVASLLLLLNFSKTYLIATVGAWFCFWVAKSPTKGRAVRTLVLCSALVAVFATTPNPLVQRLFFDKDMTVATFLQSPSDYLDVLNTSGRITIWDYVLTEASRSSGGFWLGGGLGFTKQILADNPFGSIALAPHSDYIRLLADFGWVGLCTYLVLLFVLGGRFVRLLRSTYDPWLRAISASGLMMSVYLLIGGVGYEMLNRPRGIMLTYFLVLGLSARTEKQIGTTTQAAVTYRR